MLALADIEQAAERLTSHLYAAPLLRTPGLEALVDGQVYCKAEHLQRSGSFKIRGALNSLLQFEDRALARGVVTASAGNHGLGVAHAAQLRGCQVKVFVPENASPAKLAKLGALGAETILAGSDYDEAERAAQAYSHEQRLPFIHAFDDDPVIAGQGTVGWEILAKSPALMAVVVPVGGGGLLGGVGMALKESGSRAAVIGVQSHASPAMQHALEQGRVVETPIDDTVADGLAGRFVTAKTLKLAQNYCDDMLLVTEEQIKQAMRLCYERQGWRIEGSAAVGIAALVAGKVDLAGGTCVVIITGGNISAELFHEQIA